MNLGEKINYLLSTKTFGHSAITFSSTFINGLLGIIFFIILARNLGVEVYGQVAVAIATFILVSDLGDLGVNTGIINFVSKYLKPQPYKSYQFMKLALKIKVLIWILIASLGVFLAPLIAQNILLKSELTFSLQLAFIGVGGGLLFSLVTNSLLAFQKYLSWGLMTIFTNAFRLLLILMLLSMIKLDGSSALISYIISPLIGFFVGLMFLPADFFKVKEEDQVAKEFFEFNRWIAMVTILGAVILRMDTYLVTRFLPIAEVGIYSVASQLSMVVPQIIFAIATVVAPKLASLRSGKLAKKYLISLQQFCLGIAALALLGIPLAIFVIPNFYGFEYQGAIAPFTVLLFAQLLFLISVPAHQAVFYYFSQPQILVLSTLIQLLILALVGFYLIPIYGMMGAAWAVLGGTLINLIVPSIWVINRFRI